MRFRTPRLLCDEAEVGCIVKATGLVTFRLHSGRTRLHKKETAGAASGEPARRWFPGLPSLCAT